MKIQVVFTLCWILFFRHFNVMEMVYLKEKLWAKNDGYANILYPQHFILSKCNTFIFDYDELQLILYNLSENHQNFYNIQGFPCCLILAENLD